ncbi:hypothetical protein [Pseudomonas sp. W2-17]|uniref:hypothetical protein n=1 Tax=Pseudomonas sp. W2-17 TaxID=3058039 RepID=UPI0034E06E4A
MIDIQPDIDFVDDLEAQLAKAYSKLELIAEEFSKCEPDQQTSRESRIETLELIASIKNILDQITFKVWSSIFIEEQNERTAKDVYYPYAADEQMFRSALGKMTKGLTTSDKIDAKIFLFTEWLRATQPIAGIDSRLVTIGKLSRVHHRKLIDQKKSRIYSVEAHGANGGGCSMTFFGKPGRFTIWTYVGIHGAITSMGGYPTINREEDPDAELTVFNFDPLTMDFDHVEGAKTSVAEYMICKVEDLEFDAMELFGGALAAVGEIVEISRANGYLGADPSDDLSGNDSKMTALGS